MIEGRAVSQPARQCCVCVCAPRVCIYSDKREKAHFSKSNRVCLIKTPSNDVVLTCRVLAVQSEEHLLCSVCMEKCEYHNLMPHGTHNHIITYLMYLIGDFSLVCLSSHTGH